MLSPQETRIIEYGKAQGKSRAQVIAALEKYRVNNPPQTVSTALTPPEREGTGYGARFAGEVKKAGEDIVESTQRGAELMQEGKPFQGAARAGLGAAGGFIRGAFSPVTAAIAPVFQKGIEASGVMEKEGVQSAVEKLSAWAEEHPDAAANLQDITDVALLGTVGAGGRAAKPAIKAGLEGAAGAAKTSASRVAPAVDIAGEAATGAVGKASRAVGNVRTNVAAARAQEQAVQSLSKGAAQDAARSGISVADVKLVQSLPKEGSTQYNKLIEGAKKFSAGETRQDPIGIVGQPIVNRLKQLEIESKKIGAQLGEASEKLGKLTSRELELPVFNAMKRVPDLQDLILKRNGVLDFSRTSLASSMTKGDRQAIQEAFTQAIKAGTGRSKHLYRQELFRVIGGKKKSLTQMTDTQPLAMNAIRSGLLKVLEKKNPAYRELSTEYSRLINPLKEFKKFMKMEEGVADDLLEASASILARRLTSRAVSNPKIRHALRQLDDATKVNKGRATTKTESLQDLYNLLGTYYDIAGKTSFEGGIKNVVIPKGVGELIVSKTKELGGQTPAVKQKALEKLLTETFGKTSVKAVKATKKAATKKATKKAVPKTKAIIKSSSVKKAVPKKAKVKSVSSTKSTTKKDPARFKRGFAKIPTFKKTTKTIEALKLEAKKYKSADEFIKAIEESGKSGVQFAGTTIFETFPSVYARVVSKLKPTGKTTLSPRFVNSLEIKLKNFESAKGFRAKAKILEDAEDNIFAYLKKPFEKLGKKEQWAIKDVNITENGGKTFFRVEPEIMGIGKTRSQLIDIWNKANNKLPKAKGAATPKNALATQAKQYKTADEFVKSQGKPLYHGGTGDIKDIQLGKSNFQKTFYMSENPTYAKSYGGSKSSLNEIVLDSSAKLADLRKPTPEIIAKIESKIAGKPTGKVLEFTKPDGTKIKIPEIKGGKQNAIHSTREILDGIKDGKAYFAEQAEVKSALKELGYDGMITQESKFGANYGVWNPSVVKTRSQLTDIWNKANPKKEGDLFALHNTRADNLARALETGSMPTPSIAITKKGVEFNSFGEITLVGNSKLINPANPANKAFGGDIYSIRTPRPKYDVLSSAKVNQLAAKYKPKNGQGELITDSEKLRIWTRDWGKEQTVERFTPVGKKLDPNTQAFIDEVYGEPFVALKHKRPKGELGQLMKEDPMVEKFFRESRDWDDFELSMDSEYSISKRIEEMFEAKYPKLDYDTAKEKFMPLLEKQYGYKASYTGKNIVKAVEQELNIAGKDLRGSESFLPPVRVQGYKKFKSIDDIKANKHKLMPEDVAKAAGEASEKKLNDFVNGLDIKPSKYSSMDANYEEIVRKGWYENTDKIKEFIGVKTNADAKRVGILLKEAYDQVPTTYFEVKAIREVKLGEFDGALVPPSTPKHVVDKLKKKGIKVVRYDGTNKGRLEQLAGFAGSAFGIMIIVKETQ